MENDAIKAKIDNVINLVKLTNPEADTEMIMKAYNLARGAHEGQSRRSGEDYIIHPVAVSYILVSEMQMDTETIVAGILHDVIEDTDYSYDDIKREYNETVADLVEGVTKIGKIAFQSKEESQVENLRKMVLAMSKDIRVILIKLVDRLHNMRTLEYMKESKQLEKARETLNIYTPIANRLGISAIKCELEDLSLRYLDPDGYYHLVQKIKVTKNARESYIAEVIEVLKREMASVAKDAKIYGRAKHFYSIYRKMKNQNKSFEEIHDLIAVRIIVNTVKECYAAFGLVHSLWTPIPGRIKDYIAMPKPNLYQSLHTTVMGPNGAPFEIQIRTHEMHKTAEFGIAAHWRYKEAQNESKDGKKNEPKAEEDLKDGKSAPKVTDDEKERESLEDPGEGEKGTSKSPERSRQGEFEKQLGWLNNMLVLQQETEDAAELLEGLKVDLLSDEVFVFSPKGKVIPLPSGSCPLDFAYRIHSDIGNHCVGAKVNNKIVPLNSTLKSGDIVEVMTSKHSNGPSRDWLSFIRSPHARNKIKQYFKKEEKEENIQKGRLILEREIKREGLQGTGLLNISNLELLAEKFEYKNLNDFLSAVGYNGIKFTTVFQKMRALFPKEFPDETEEIELKKPKTDAKKGSSAIIVAGKSDIDVHFSKCCNPVPGDNIVGYITKLRGISIHRADCSNVLNLKDPNRMVDVEWNKTGEGAFQAGIKIKAKASPQTIVQISKTFADMGIPITAFHALKDKDDNDCISATLEVKSRRELTLLIKNLNKIKEVIQISRI